jgi:hypothetical protein
MRLFDGETRIGCYLDGVNLRLERGPDTEHKVIDLTLRVQPFTAELAAALHPDVRALLFTMNDASPKPLLKSVELKLPALTKQHLDCYLLPDEDGTGGFSLMHAEISDPRVRTEKGVDGYALVFYATVGPVGKDELEFAVGWYTQQRFVSFTDAQGELPLDEKATQEPATPTHRKRQKRTEAAESTDGTTH